MDLLARIGGVMIVAMLTNAQIDTLGSFALFAPVPRAELEWLGTRGDVHRLAPGTVFRDVGSPIDEMWIVLAGRVAVHVRKGVEAGGSFRKFYDMGLGYVLGAMPYSRIRVAPGRLIAEDETDLFTLHRSHFPDLVSECHELTSVLVHHLLDRTRSYRTAELHDERMQSLGRLAAGLAHELNNPASAATQHARSLTSLLADTQAAAVALARARLTDAQLDEVDTLRRVCLDAAPRMSPMDVADREEEFSDWLLAHGLDPLAACVLAPSRAGIAALDRLAAAVPANSLGVAIGWATSDASTRQAAAHISEATERIHAMVSAVKGFTFMDREGVPENVDVARGLADTVAVLENKARTKSLHVRIETAHELPPVYGLGSELNQVWEKLIDNAIDAAPIGGTVTVTAAQRGTAVLVSIADDGVGIAEEHRARIFDPFFTTKPVGSPGLGLDIARRFANLNDGDLDFSSEPGHTVFRVRLPVAGTKTASPREVTDGSA